MSCITIQEVINDYDLVVTIERSPEAFILPHGNTKTLEDLIHPESQVLIIVEGGIAVAYKKGEFGVLFSDYLFFIDKPIKFCDTSDCFDMIVDKFKSVDSKHKYSDWSVLSVFIKHPKTT